MIDDSINHEYIIRYIRDVLPKRSGLLGELEDFANENQVPISQPETVKLLEVLIKLGGRKQILELGTAIGYSAVCMARAGGGQNGSVQIDTVEINSDAANYAKNTFRRAGLEDKITLYEGDANDVLPRLYKAGKRYDMIFIDAAKAQYSAFFEYCFNMLEDGGLLVSDNVLYKGMTATDDLVLHRKRTIVKRLRDYVSMLCGNRRLETAIVPIGDGVALSIKKTGIETELG